MKWDVRLPDTDDVFRLEVQSRQEGESWGAYICLAFRGHPHLCWLIGEEGLPFRFAGASRDEAERNAKEHLESKYKVLRKVWS